jgi:serine/threonine protein kinase
MKDDSSIFAAGPEKLNRLFSLALGERQAPEPPATSPDGTAGQATVSVDAASERPGGRIGRYKLLRVLGEGGMGIVYLAEQEEPVKRQVALKVIKPGMDSKRVIARFEAEQQALALMDHPHVAQVYDAGLTLHGRPYFVMEYVKGIPVTEHCDKYKLTIEERLRLFLHVCEAIRHAHQKGIIHRDLKPSNILVTVEGNEAIPKVIDFGVARAISQPLTQRTLFTEQGQLVGTPEYMSPEQVEMSNQDIDTRADIYSLGAVLYELIAGVLPFDPQALREGGFDHIRKVLCEEEPKTPSTRLSKTSVQELAQSARCRRTSAKTLQRRLHGDLDWIVMKAMEKDRTRRYGTAEALAEDIERHLNHQPVSAGSPGILYRLQKFLRRHRTQAIAAGFLLAVVILLAAIVGQYHRGRERLRAVQRESEARQEALALENARSSLSTAQADYASGRYTEALKALNVLVDNRYVGSQARLLRARMALDQPDVNVPMSELEALLTEPNEIASQAHLLLAQIYGESRADDDKTAGELERKAAEHLQEAERLGSNSADAFFGRALLSDTPAERMELLNKALNISSSHVNSLRIRALAHYASRNYDEMDNDASVMKAVAKNNPEGYALRALALREKAQLRGRKELLSRAVDEHTKAIELAPTQLRFYDERRETYMRMGEYDKALADANACIQLSPEEGIYHFHAFCALTALGRYPEAQREYETILAQSGSSTRDYQFRRWAGVYALDIVDRRSPWHAAGPEPQGAAFTVIGQTIEAHENLAKKARCVVREGFRPTWSPDGEELAYARGILGYTVIEVLNVKSGTTRLVCYTGLDPAWSPDGRYIAFVRHRRTVRLQDLADGRRTYYNPRTADREVWIVNADGTGRPRMLARGGNPSWSRDPTRLYYWSPEEGGYLCSISIAGNNARPKRVIRTPSFYPMMSSYPMISPDENYVVWFNQGSIGSGPVEVVELSSAKVVASWLGHRPTWSPDGKKIVFGREDGRHDGMWVYDLEKGKAARFVDDWIGFWSSWSANTGQIAWTLGQTGKGVYSGMVGSIWVGPLDYRIFGPDSSALILDWPRDESDARSLWQMIGGYQGMPERTAEAEQLRRRLVEVLQQAVASGDPNSLRAVEQIPGVDAAFDRYDGAKQLYLQARDRQLAKPGVKVEGLPHPTEELVRLYLDLLNRCGEAEQLCLELLKTGQEVLGAEDPRAIRTRILLARVYERQKRYQEAEQLYLDILKTKPNGDAKDSTPEVYETVFWLLAFAPLGYSPDEQALVIRLLDNETTEIPKDKRWMISAHYLLARLYATCPVAELHNTTKAIEHGTTACELSGWAESICLDALAAAYAEAGRFDLAVQRQKEAIERLSGVKAWMRTVFASRLTMYEHGLAKSPKGLVARWEFEQSKDRIVPDTSGNNLHGRLVGDAQVYADPDRGNVLRLDGAGDWVDCGADAMFDVIDEITVSVWIKVGKFDKEWQAIVTKGDSTWRLLRNRTTDTLAFACSGVNTPETGPYGTVYGRVNVNDGRWHHVAGVYDGRRLSLYVDGELDTAVPTFASTRINTSTERVGVGMNSATRPPREWNGLIDDLRIYGYALSPEDIRALHEGREPSRDKASIR